MNPLINPSVLRRGLGWRACIAAVTMLLSALLIACGGGGVVPSTGVTIRTLSSEFTARKAVAYSPYRSANRDTETVTAANILQDLNLLVAGGFKMIRLFDSSDAVAAQTLQLIRQHNLDIKMQLGMYILSESAPGLSETQKAVNRSFNQAEIERGITLANTYRDIVLAVSVGNETMVNWSFVPTDPTVMASYITSVRNRVTQPVTTNDNWAFWASAPTKVLDAVDFVALHTYPLADSVHNPGAWDWQQTGVAQANRAAAMMDAAIASAQKDYAAVRSYLDSKGLQSLPIVIGETGWKAVASGGETYRAHPVNQKMYFDRLSQWFTTALNNRGPKSIMYFEAFDEPWKQGDDKWGLFNVQRQARYVIQSLYPASSWEPGSYTAADAVAYRDVTSNGPVTANRYAVYADTVVSGEARPPEALVWNAWENGSTAAYTDATTYASPTDGGRGLQITPKPLSWGWGLALAQTINASDLSNFSSTGTLNFSIKTTYAGKLEIGFLTGTAANNSLYDVYLAIAPGQYGYQNDGTWRQVSIPIRDIIPAGARAFGMENSAASVLDLTRVTNTFVIADRYGKTGNSAGQTAVIWVDGVSWGK